jgi:hypothetical protein
VWGNPTGARAQAKPMLLANPPFAPSATVDTTNAANITSGILPIPRLSGSYTGITGTGTLVAGATGAGFTVDLGTSTVLGVLTVPNGGTGAATFTPNLPLIGNGASAIAQGSSSGNTTKFATVTGAFTPGDCVSIDASGNVVAAGGACTTGGGGGTVAASTIGQVPVYTAATTVTGNPALTSSAGALTVGVPNTTLGTITLEGNASGAVTIQPQAVAGGWNFNLPTSAGTAGQVLTSQGGGSTAMTWTSVSGASGVVSAGSINQLAWYAANGSTVSGLATANNGTLVTSAGGVPSIGSTLPSAVQSNITSLGTITSGVWNGTAITGSNIAANTVTNSNRAQMSATTTSCNSTGSTANATDCSVATMQTMLGLPTAFSVTRANIPTTSFPSTLNSFVSAGYATANDRGAGCIYVRGTSASPGAIQDAGSNYWGLPIGKAYDVGCFGAKMDGITNDTVAVQAALNAPPTGAGTTRLVTFPGGTTILDSVVIPSNTTVRGSGKTVIQAGATTTQIFIITDAVEIINVLIEDFHFVSSTGETGVQTAGAFVIFNNCYNCELGKFFANGAWDVVIIEGTNNSNVRVHDAYIFGTVDAGITVSGGADQYIHHVVMNNQRPPADATGGTQPNYGIKVTNTGGLWVSDSDISYSGNGIGLVPTSGRVENVFIGNTAIDSNNGQGLLLQPTSGANVYSVFLTNSWTSNSRGSGIYSACSGGGTVDGVVAVGNRAINNGGHGAEIHCGSHYTFNGSSWVGNSNPGNGGAGGVLNGISIFSGVSHVTAISNTFAGFGQTNFQANGIVIQGPSNDYYNIYLNDCTGGYSLSCVADGGTGTHKNIGLNLP